MSNSSSFVPNIEIEEYEENEENDENEVTEEEKEVRRVFNFLKLVKKENINKLSQVILSDEFKEAQINVTKYLTEIDDKGRITLFIYLLTDVIEILGRHVKSTAKGGKHKRARKTRRTRTRKN